MPFTFIVSKALRFVLTLAFLVFGAIAASPARADAVDDALAGFTTDKYDDTDKAIQGVILSGAAMGGAIFDALGAGRLVFDPQSKTVLYKDASGALKLAKTGEPAPAELAGKPLKTVRLNNRLRRAVEAASGAFELRSPDRAKRIGAAKAIFKTREPTALPSIEAALAAESDPKVKEILTQARAAIVVGKADAPEADRAAAAATVAAVGDADALAALTNLPADSPPAVSAAAAAGVAAIERWQSVANVVQNLVYGLSLGSVLLLAAIGLAITFGVMGVINMAHGEMVMIGAYATFLTQAFIADHVPALNHASLVIAIPVAFLVAGGVGVLIERTVIRFLYGRPLETLLATWGVSLILQQLVRTLFGPSNREVSTPEWLQGSVEILGVSLTWNRIAIILFALAVFAALQLLLRRTSLGLQVRAVTQNRRMAGSMGIRTARVDALTFGLGSGVAGIAGVALSQIDNVSPNLGQSYIIDSFLVVVFGGVGNLYGTLVGAMSIGVANKLLEPWAGAVLGKIVLLVAIILFIQKRPRGLFALKGRAVEA
ncbi:urea ABC transporter permease subunit UrtB [Hansschlegelia plantiphila]|uniref:Branched-chain amino acid ABC transporter permease n=1 Tax=Hansschlegelia plantiphila TaxID=374655 RepID=A0A9W6J1M2_9HYPH|nr:urea ABC transporter permease subunit UrtB [Hansschlegelia plantiphila]GLK68073.1 branched-chain amino acid ABC transporter permease [Hansschlegelia plantiphila]